MLNFVILTLLPSLVTCSLTVSALGQLEQDTDSTWIRFLCDLQNHWPDCKQIILISWPTRISHKRLEDCWIPPVVLLTPNMTERVPSLNTNQQAAVILTDDTNLTNWLPKTLSRLPKHPDLRITVALLFLERDLDLFESVMGALWLSDYVNGVILHKDESDEVSFYRYYPYSADSCAVPGRPVLVTRSKSAVSLPKAVYADNRLENFNGCVLRCGVFPPVKTMKKMKWVTYRVAEFQEKLIGVVQQDNNFTCKLNVTSDLRGWGFCLPNGTMIGLLGDICTHRVDIGLADYEQTIDRWLVSDLMKSYRDDCLTGTTLVGMGEKKSIWAVLVREFSPEMWVYIGMSVVMASVFMLLFTNVAETYLPGSRIFDSFIGAAFFSLQTLLGAPIRVQMESNAARFFITMWFMFSIIVTAAYVAAFSSLVTVPWYPKDIDTLEGLVEAKLTLITHITLLPFLVDDDPKSAASKLRKTAQTHHNPWYETLWQMLRDRNKAALYPKFSVRNMMAQMNISDAEQFHVFKDLCLSKAMVSPMIARKGSPLTRSLDRAVERIIESGLTDYWLRSIPLSPRFDILRMKPFTLRNVLSAFVVHAIGLLLATLVFIFERLSFKSTKRQHPLKRGPDRLRGHAAHDRIARLRTYRQMGLFRPARQHPGDAVAKERLNPTLGWPMKGWQGWSSPR